MAEKSTNSERGEPFEPIPTGTSRSRKTDQRPEREGSGKSNFRLPIPYFRVLLFMGGHWPPRHGVGEIEVLHLVVNGEH